MPERHSEERRDCALAQAHQLWCQHDASALPIFHGGGRQFDVYAYRITYPTSTSAYPGEKAAPITREFCLRVPREEFPYFAKVGMVTQEVHWRKSMARYKIKGVQQMNKPTMYDATNDNELGSPYIALEWAQGRKLEWNDKVPAKEEHRRKVLKQIADITMNMLRIRREPEEETGAREFMEGIIEQRIAAITRPAPQGFDNHPASAGLDAASSLSINDRTSADKMRATQQRLLDKYIRPEIDTSPFVLVHGDVGPANIIVDDEYNVTLIGFSLMEQVPLHFAASFPRFLTHEPTPINDKEGLDTRREVAGWARGWGGNDTPQMREDRKTYLEFVNKLATKEAHGKVPMDDKLREAQNDVILVMNGYARLLEGGDEVGRYWWMTAMQRAEIWEQMERCGWKPKLA